MHRTRLLVALAFAALLLAAPAAPASSSGVVVSQVYAGGGNAGASFTNDFVELFNRRLVDGRPHRLDRPVRVRRRHELAGDRPRRVDRTRPPLPRAARSAAAVGAPLPDSRRDRHDQPRRLRRQGRGRRAARRSSPAARSAGSCSGVAGIEDLVGYGSRHRLRGRGGRGALSSSTAAMRAGAGCTDTDSNAADFAAATPTPRNTSSAATQLRRRASRAVRRRHASVERRHPARSCRSRSSSSAISFGSAVAGHDACPGLRAGHRRQQRRGRLLADRPPHRVHAGRPPARHREHGSVQAARSARRARRRRARPVPIAPAADLLVGTHVGRRTAAGDVWPTTLRLHRRRCRRSRRATTRRPSPTR